MRDREVDLPLICFLDRVGEPHDWLTLVSSQNFDLLPGQVGAQGFSDGFFGGPATRHALGGSAVGSLGWS